MFLGREASTERSWVEVRVEVGVMVAVVEVRANPPSPSNTTTAMYRGVPAVGNTRERGLEVGRMEDRAVPPRRYSTFAGEEVAALAPHTPWRLTELLHGRVPPAAKAMGK